MVEFAVIARTIGSFDADRALLRHVQSSEVPAYSGGPVRTRSIEKAVEIALVIEQVNALINVVSLMHRIHQG